METVRRWAWAWVVAAVAAVAAVALGALSGCGQIVLPPMDGETARKAGEHRERQAELSRVAGWMTGSFSSRAQAWRDREFRDIRLHAVRIWPNRNDGVWLYVEQAEAERPTRPYRQRVYRLRIQDNGLIVSDVLTLPGEPLRFAEAWKDVSRLGGLTPADLTAKPGCEVVLKRTADDLYEGGTVGEGCASELGGAAYATSDVRVGPDGLDSWDRGFDASGKQVWGSVKGPYEFRRIVP
ncbi:MAG: hypothetical protein HRU70_09995 [Phycisphaeraceae bacterium]|nr:MAG: hypothetical protein HRU70_09995 [Phycisphaeraceae bacterium]